MKNLLLHANSRITGNVSVCINIYIIISISTLQEKYMLCATLLFNRKTSSRIKSHSWRMLFQVGWDERFLCESTALELLNYKCGLCVEFDSLTSSQLVKVGADFQSINWQSFTHLNSHVVSIPLVIVERRLWAD